MDPAEFHKSHGGFFAGFQQFPNGERSERLFVADDGLKRILIGMGKEKLSDDYFLVPDPVTTLKDIIEFDET